MPKIFLLASAVLLLLSSGLSFLNKNKLAAKNAEISQSHDETAAAQRASTAAAAAAKKAEKARDEAATKATDLQTQLSASASTVSDLNGKLADATKSVADKDAQIADLNKKITSAGPAIPGATPAPDADAKIAELTHQRDELTVVKESLENQLKGAQAQAASLQRQATARASGESMNGLRGQVLAVDHNWNFVVLNLGGRRGVNNNATMIIQRGGSLVGRVKITSVEPEQSVADIIPNSVPAGIEVRPGDTVVFPGS